MQFSDEKKALVFLSRISYFRLKYYWIDMLDDSTENEFQEDACFDDVIERYEFDKQLRQILFNAIEILEVGLRSKVINILSQQASNGLWYLDKSLFENANYHENFVLELKYEFGRSTDPFARDYINKHTSWEANSFDGDNPDAWMIFETATFGTLSKMYKNLKPQLPARSFIAGEFGLYSSKELSSWLESISVLRNVIAHHSRLWYRIFPKKPITPKGQRDQWLNAEMTDNQKKRAFGVISTLLYLTNAICPNNTIKADVLELFDKHPNVPVYRLGFTDHWKKHPLWK